MMCDTAVSRRNAIPRLIRAAAAGVIGLAAADGLAGGSAPVVAEVPTPQPEPRQVLIRLQAAGMQTLDYLLATGAWRPAPATFPMVLGADGAGVVERVGEGATRFAPGEPVFGQLFLPPIGSTGTYAEYVAVPQDAPLARVPNGLDPVVAAALPTAGMAGLSLIEQLGPT